MKMKMIICGLGIFSMFSCSSTKNNARVIGGEKDKHGCIAAAGQSWSELNRECVQIFNIGLRLNPIQMEKGQATISNFVLFNKDKSKLELFLTDGKNVILNQAENNIYKNGKYLYNSVENTLYINGKRAYQAEK